MSRQARIIIPAIFLMCSVVFSGCKTIYSDVYSPRRNHFIPVKTKPKPEPTPLIDTAPPPGSDIPSLGLPPAAPPSAPMEAPPMPDAGAPAPIPGL